MATSLADECPPLLLTEGGPGGALLRLLRVAPLGHASRRTALILAGVTWVPLCLLAALDGVAVGRVHIPFLYDLAAHVRFLLAVPVLVLAEIPIGVRLRDASRQMVTDGLVAAEDVPRFAALIGDTVRLRDSRVAELIVLAAAWLTAYGVLSNATVQGGSTWQAPDAQRGLTLAGAWYVLVAIPIFQFLIFRWLYRMMLWTWFLGRLTRLDLRLTPTHPDGAGGLGFLGKACVPFGVLLFALSAVTASAIATRVLFEGAQLRQYQFSYAALLLLLLAIFTSPLLVFLPKLAVAKRRGLLEYGTLASEYTQRFDRKWIKSRAGADEPLLGTADIQSLADLGNSYAQITKMRLLPLQLRDFLAMVVPGVLPVLPLAATVMPVSEIVKGVLHLLV